MEIGDSCSDLGEDDAMSLALKGVTLDTARSSQFSRHMLPTPRSQSQPQLPMTSLQQHPNPSPPHSERQLAVQMYSHLKAQRQLERRLKSRGDERGKRRHFLCGRNSAEPGVTSETLFGSKWGNSHPLPRGYAPLGVKDSREGAEKETASAVLDSRRQEHKVNFSSRTAQQPPGANVFFGKADTSQQTTKDRRCEQDNALFKAVSRDKKQNVSPNITSGLLSSRKANLEINNQRAMGNSNRPTSKRELSRGAPGSGHSFHVIKGPGRIQIKFGGPPPSRQRDTERRFQWDETKTGVLIPRQLSFLTIDGSYL